MDGERNAVVLGQRAQRLGIRRLGVAGKILVFELDVVESEVGHVFHELRD